MMRKSTFFLSDNLEYLRELVMEEIKEKHPGMEVSVEPCSYTDCVLIHFTNSNNTKTAKLWDGWYSKRSFLRMCSGGFSAMIDYLFYFHRNSDA